MEHVKPGTTVNLYQEDWFPYQDLPNALKKFTQETGIAVNLSWDKADIANLEKMWTEMVRSFTSDEPPYDLVCADDTMLLQNAYKGCVQGLNDYIAADNYDLDDFEKEALQSVMLNEELYGLPCSAVCNILLYRADLFDKYRVKVPENMDELYESAVAIQDAVRADGKSDFFGFTSRGATGGGYISWTVATSWAPSWGVEWFDLSDNPNFDTKDHVEALSHYIQLLKDAAPPEQADMDFVDTMKAYEDGRVAMNVEVGMEYGHLYGKKTDIAEGSRCALIPAGPTGERHSGLYSPSFAIPKKSKVKQEAWELAKFLCSFEQQTEDGLHANSVETARNSVLYSSDFAKHFREDLLEAVQQTRKHAREERPVSQYGLQISTILGEEYNSALRGNKSPDEAIRAIQQRVSELGPRW